jgi:thiamine biosynthesis protein ThiS
MPGPARRMTIILNGEKRHLTAPCSVGALLDQLGIDARVVAVEVNRAVIKRTRHHDTVITDGAEVEIVSFVGGGADSVGSERDE